MPRIYRALFATEFDANRVNADSDSSTPEESVQWSALAALIRRLTHDVRNDLNAMELQLTLLEDAHARQALASEDIAALRTSLHLAEKRLRKLSARVRPVAPTIVRTRAEDLWENVTILADRAGHKSRNTAWSFGAAGTWLNGDVDLLSDAVLEIVDNAVAFGEGGDNINVLAVADGSSLRIILKEVCRNTPENVSSWGAALMTTRGSYGLGLHYAQRIIAAHSGRIDRVFDPSTRQLTTTITLPRAN